MPNPNTAAAAGFQNAEAYEKVTSPEYRSVVADVGDCRQSDRKAQGMTSSRRRTG
jgi:hypothetical protein